MQLLHQWQGREALIAPLEISIEALFEVARTTAIYLDA
jgi:hypothetical protein